MKSSLAAWIRKPTLLLMVIDSIFPTTWKASSLMVFILPL